MKILLLLMIAISLFSADQIVSREGDVVTVIASGEYIMGDSDNRKEARTMALTQAKVNASEVAGTYIESNFESVIKQTNDSQVDKVTKQELRSFSAAILQSEITNDIMEMLANKTTVYKITIKAKIDLATLRERVKQIGEDKTKKDRLIGLEKENSVLTSALQKLSEQMRDLEKRKSVKPEEVRALRDERERLFAKIEKNEGAVKLIFDKKIVLNEYQQRKATLEDLKYFISNELFKDLSQKVKISIDKPKINTKAISIPFSVSLIENKLCPLFQKVNASISAFSGSETSEFKDLIEKAANKNRLFISIPGVIMESIIPLNLNSDRSSDSCLHLIYNVEWSPYYAYGLKKTLNLTASEEIISNLTELNAEIVYLKYPSAFLLDTDYNRHLDGFGRVAIWNIPESTENVGITIDSKKIVAIDSIPVKNDTDYFRIIKNKIPGSEVEIDLQDDQAIQHIRKTVYDAKSYEEMRANEENARQIKSANEEITREIFHVFRSALNHPGNVARRTGLKGDVTISFVLLESSAFIDLIIEKSSDNAILDNIILDTFRNIAANGRLPKPSQNMKITMPFRIE